MWPFPCARSRGKAARISRIGPNTLTSKRFDFRVSCVLYGTEKAIACVVDDHVDAATQLECTRHCERGRFLLGDIEMQDVELAHACIQVDRAIAHSADDGIAAIECSLGEGLPKTARASSDEPGFHDTLLG